MLWIKFRSETRGYFQILVHTVHTEFAHQILNVESININNLGQKFGLAKFLVGICFASKEFGPKNFLAKNIWVGNLFGSKKCGSEIFLGQKNLGRKFGLAKFYFALLRFVCVMLLITAKLNNNNTEFHWVVVGQYTHNLVKPTFTWLWLSWVLTTANHLDPKKYYY